jgi:hypothetical protein
VSPQQFIDWLIRELNEAERLSNAWEKTVPRDGVARQQVDAWRGSAITLRKVIAVAESLKVDQENAQVLLMTFEQPRKVYLKSVEWYPVANLWRHGLLVASRTGTDQYGEYQVFSWADKGRRRVVGEQS